MRQSVLQDMTTKKAERVPLRKAATPEAVLEDIVVREVSTVPKAANGRRFLVVKSAGAEKVVEIVKDARGADKRVDVEVKLAKEIAAAEAAAAVPPVQVPGVTVPGTPVVADKDAAPPADEAADQVGGDAEVDMAAWDTAYVNDLPDSAFLYVEGGGSKDAGGKTEPRSLRHFPVRDSGGAVDLPHLRNALSRIPQSDVPQSVKDKAAAEAQRLLADASKSAPAAKVAKDAGPVQLAASSKAKIVAALGIASQKIADLVAKVQAAEEPPTAPIRPVPAALCEDFWYVSGLVSGAVYVVNELEASEPTAAVEGALKAIVAKAGRKIAGHRLKRFKEALDSLLALAKEFEDVSAEAEAIAGEAEKSAASKAVKVPTDGPQAPAPDPKPGSVAMPPHPAPAPIAGDVPDLVAAMKRLTDQVELVVKVQAEAEERIERIAKGATGSNVQPVGGNTPRGEPSFDWPASLTRGRKNTRSA